MLPLTSKSHRCRCLLSGSIGTALLGVSLASAAAQDPAGGAIVPPRAGRVSSDNDPLRRRSAEENVVFGRIVSTDEHRLTLREGEEVDGPTTSYRLSPTVRVYSGDQEIRLSDLPANARIRFQRNPKATAEVVELFIDDRDETAARPGSSVGFGLILTGDADRVIVADVRKDGPADKAGLQAGDRLIRLNDVVLVDPQDVLNAAAELSPGDRPVLIVRRGDDELQLKLTVTDDVAARDTVSVDDAADPTRVVKTNGDAPSVSTEVVRPVKLGATLETTPDGVAVVRIDDVSPLRDAGVRPGDYIKTAAGIGVATPEGLFRVLNRFDGGANVEMTAERNAEPMDFTLTLPADHEKVLVESSTAKLAPDSETRIRVGRRQLNNEELLEQILRNQQRQQAQLNYLYEAMQRLAQAANVNDDVLGVAPVGLFGGPQFGGNGSNCLCAIGLDPQGNAVIGFTRNGQAVAVVSINAGGTPVLAESKIVSPGNNGQNSPTDAGVDNNCFCPIATDPNGNPIIGVTQQGVPVAVSGNNADGRPILVESTFAQNDPIGAQNDQTGENPGRGDSPDGVAPPTRPSPELRPEPDRVVPFLRNSKNR